MTLREAIPSSLSAVFNAGAMAALAGRPEAKEILKKAVELFEASSKSWDPREMPTYLAPYRLRTIT